MPATPTTIESLTAHLVLDSIEPELQAIYDLSDLAPEEKFSKILDNLAAIKQKLLDLSDKQRIMSSIKATIGSPQCCVEISTLIHDTYRFVFLNQQQKIVIKLDSDTQDYFVYEHSKRLDDQKSKSFLVEAVTMLTIIDYQNVRVHVTL